LSTAIGFRPGGSGVMGHWVSQCNYCPPCLGDGATNWFSTLLQVQLRLRGEQPKETNVKMCLTQVEFVAYIKAYKFVQCSRTQTT